MKITKNPTVPKLAAMADKHDQQLQLMMGTLAHAEDRLRHVENMLYDVLSNGAGSQEIRLRIRHLIQDSYECTIDEQAARHLFRSASPNLEKDQATRGGQEAKATAK